MVLWFANARGPTRRFLYRVFKASRVMALWTRVKTQEKDLRVGTRHWQSEVHIHHDGAGPGGRRDSMWVGERASLRILKWR